MISSRRVMAAAPPSPLPCPSLPLHPPSALSPSPCDLHVPILASDRRQIRGINSELLAACCDNLGIREGVRAASLTGFMARRQTGVMGRQGALGKVMGEMWPG
ncbi:hypothetical protein E2C01_097834 [Portunus trituberculatus]|uniref:Uncharacterized protein n=1 Tax=Portunus trituberculatus TaxID=210409 RepID=A0A5B7JW85_PORTR|nr:hypothetical protein [Portunus trituberculatus]